MGIVVVNEIASPMLTTVPAFKRRKRISDATDDGLIEDLIREASAEAVRYCGRSFARARVRESGLQQEIGSVAVSLTPLIEVHSVSRGGEPILDFRIEDAGAGLIAAASGILAAGEARWWSDSFVHGGMESFEVEYTGGYLTPEEATGVPPTAPPRTLPYDLEGAVIEMVAAVYEPQTSGAGRTIKSVKVEDITYQYETDKSGGGESLLSITDRLDRWVRIT